MSCVPVIVSGDDTAISITLKKNNATFDIPTATATVTAAVISTDKRTQYITGTSVISSTQGSDWPNSLVVVEFTSTQTSTLPTGGALVEVQVEDNGKLTWFGSIKMTGDTIP